jgi:ATP adenylyltransferase
MQRLFSPWRLRYVAGATRPVRGCVFCRALRPGAGDLVLLRGRSHFVILNKFPYSNGHLMIVPRRHLATPAESSPEALLEMVGLMVRCEEALRRVYRPTGINVGMNLGKSAGAGITGHYHMHMVPRWDGDTNFMTVVHSTRVIPESLRTTARRLRGSLRETGKGALGAPPGAVRRRGVRRVARTRP